MSSPRELKITTRGKITLGRDLQVLTQEDWVELLRAAERGTAQSVLMMCYTWHQMKLNCEDKGDTMKDICADLGVAPSAASERALIGSRANELMPFVDKLPSAIMTLYEMCKIDRDNEMVKQLLEHEIITPTTTRDDMKQLGKLAIKARSSSNLDGNIIKAYNSLMIDGKINDNVVVDESGNVIDTGEKQTPPPGGKKAQEIIADQSTHSKKEKEARIKAMADYERATDQLMELVLQSPDVLEQVCALLTSEAQDKKDAVELAQIERIFETITNEWAS